ncbi:UDP-2,3-diacylglucosamine hydrolase [Marinomonas spartinae]|uniref:UDP-2,3-diacylglucosamine hydrolase n=1 Tax=Marinomonas spartinae TaxID=1792290 RepID=A0A1A8TN57_9GAMM|nr:UDP-2,3-diacylglucosamine diphosphatase [Marinomonas spartinae]SBS34368.1 UDP-2,3-diacylglucosamine hydrolase [Marinomonas spartinae]SBS37502.1 UDP-2,3-diacylglucosamine hydrolase [Marinomonas spartinae]
MTRYFISDLHLYDKRPDLIRAFVRMLQEIADRHTNNDASLYILGDLYEAWIGDDFHADWNNPIKQALGSLSDRGVELFILHGNRDFLIGDTWCQEVGATLLSEQTLIRQGSHPILLTHGDEYCQEDIEYQKLRAMVRSTQWQTQVLSMPMEQRLALAEQLRNDSKSMSADKASNITDVTEAHVAQSMKEHHANLLIHGHTHRPALHTLVDYSRCVLGDWDDYVWLATLDDQAYTQANCSVDDFLANGLSALKKVHTLPLD